MLLLRGAVGLTAVAAGVLYFGCPAIPPVERWALGLALSAGGAAMAIGFLTPLAVFLVGPSVLGVAVSWLPTPLSGFHDTRLIALEMLIAVAAIGLLGPGAFSLDGYWFGRKEIVIPPASRRHES